VTGLSLGGGLSFRRITTATGQALVAYNASPRANVSPVVVSVVEGGPASFYYACLMTAPAGTVTVNASHDGQVDVTPASVQFTTTAWQDALAFAVTGTDDAVAEGMHTSVVTHTVSSGDPSYNGLALPNVTVNITDNDGDVSVTKTASPDPVLASSSLTYTLTVANLSHISVNEVVLTDTLPVGVAFVSAQASQGGCANNTGIVTCNLGSMASGVSATTVIVVIPGAAGDITNTATARAREFDPDLANNTAIVVTRVTAPPPTAVTLSSFEEAGGPTGWPYALVVGVLASALCGAARWQRMRRP